MCRITELRQPVFKGLNNLEVLDISFNAVNHLHGNLFHNLTNLLYLDLQYNTLVLDFNETLFSVMTQLRYLDLSYTNWFHVNSNLFSNLTNLQHLNIAGTIVRITSLVYFPSQVLMSLKSLISLDISKSYGLYFEYKPEKRFRNLSNLQHFTISTFTNFMIMQRPNLHNLTLFIESMPVDSPIGSFKLKVVDYPLKFDEQTFLPLKT